MKESCAVEMKPKKNAVCTYVKFTLNLTIAKTKTKEDTHSHAYATFQTHKTHTHTHKTTQMPIFM